MLRKYSYIATPTLCWCLIAKKDSDNVLKHGIKPTVKGINDIPGHRHQKIIYGVKTGDVDALNRLKALTGLEEYLVVKAAVPAYYKCLQESPQTQEEKEFCSEFGTPHQDILFIPKTIKPKYIIAIE